MVDALGDPFTIPGFAHIKLNRIRLRVADVCIQAMDLRITREDVSR